MKFYCKTQELSNALISVSRAVSSRSNMPVLEGVLIKSGDGCLSLTGYDLELGIKTSIEAKIQEEGSLLINAKTLSGIISHLPYEDVCFEVDAKQLCRIYCGGIEYYMNGLYPNDFPELPVVRESVELKIKAETLRDMIKKTIFSAAINDIRDIMKGLKFELSPGELKLVAIEAHRLAIRTEKINYNGEKLNFVVPGKSLGELSKLLEAQEGEISLFIGRRHLEARLNGYEVITRLLEGEFLNYAQFINDQPENMTVIETKPLIEAIERVSLIITDRFKAPVRLEFTSGKLKLSSMTQLGTAKDEMNIDYDGKQITIGFQSRYLLDALRNCEMDSVILKLKDPFTPVYITPVNDESFLYLIQPVRMVE